MRALAFLTLVAAVPATTLGQNPSTTSPVPNGPRVRLVEGTVDGRYSGANPPVAVFKGIPYAAPPIGPLRWRPPGPPASWKDVRSATEFGPSCIQSDRLVGWTRSIAAVFGTQDKVESPPLRTSEDCLSLNVWSASLGSARPPAPVMVWIHGGSNMNGDGASPWYDGEALARRGVVVVTINYRLGALGFFAEERLTAESPHRSSGNYGLLDQLEALRWVRRNIAAFGGDPRRVTLFGESAGSIDILHLMASPLSQGLFHRAIAESGAPMGGVPRLARAEAFGRELAKALGIDSTADALAALRTRPAAEILAAADRLFLAGQFRPGPVVDGWVLPEVTGRVFDTGRQLQVPLLIGSNALEMTSLRFYLPLSERSLPAYRRWVEDQFPTGSDRILALYPATTDAGVEAALLALTTDLYFTCGSRLAARSVAKSGTGAYLYQFTRVRPGGEKLGAYHAAEIPYVFGNKLAWLPGDSVDDRLSQTMGRYFARFAATGDPNEQGLPAWPRYTAAEDRSLELGSRVAAGTGLKREACDLVESGLRAQWGATPLRP